MAKPDIPPRLQADLELARSSIPERDPAEGVNLLTLRGKPALVFLGLVLFLFVANALYYRSSLSDAEAQAVRRSLTLHYRANLLAGADLDDMNPEDRLEVAALLGDFRDVELRDGAVKGWGRSRVVRVDVAVAGGPPPDGVSPRHLMLACTRSCVVMGPVGPLSFALGLWFIEAEGGAFP